MPSPAWNQIDAKSLSGRKLQLCAMSIVHVAVGWVTDLQNRYLETTRMRLFLLIYFY